MTNIPCPCCGFETLEAEYGSYVICPVCEWEDDGVQLANPTSEGGSNRRSLSDAQRASLAAYPVALQIAKGYKRSLRWRPLLAAEILAADERKADNHWHSPAVVSESEAYWSVGA